MSETTEKKRQPRTCFHIPDEVFRCYLKKQEVNVSLLQITFLIC